VENQEDAVMSDLSQLNGKVAVITGAAQGIGEATARLFAERGVSGLLLTDRQPDRLAAVEQSLRERTRVSTLVADLADPKQVATIVPAAEATFGRLDILANIAGLTDRGSVLDTDLELFDRMMAVNVRAPFFLMQDALRLMTRDRTEGTIVNILSVNAHGGAPVLSPYSASKGALATLTKNVANAMLDHRIRVNGINLGWTETPGEHAIVQSSGQGGADWLEKAEAGRPFGRLLKPEDVARLIAFLASSESGLMTGALIDFDQQVVGINRVAP
jgi:NAD(P)-dependent dehydrogenase (short-subunit alcohol dehydrogenase family)